MKVLLEKGVWLADKFFYGSASIAQPRTTIEKDAREFKTVDDALIALHEARAFEAFPNAKIQDDFI